MSVSYPGRLSRHAQQLLTLTDGLIQSGCTLEDSWWENQLAGHLDKTLVGRRNRTVENVLEVLAMHNPQAHDLFMEKAENASETHTFEHNGKAYDALLISAPIIVWTRYQLPGNLLSAEQQRQLSQTLADVVAAPHAVVGLLPTMLNVDVLPQTFFDTRALTRQLAVAALENETSKLPGEQPIDNDGILADTRFIVGVIVVPKGETIFRWQMAPSKGSYRRAEARQSWASAAHDTLSTTFTGCQAQYLCPDAYYTNNREADHHIRPIVLMAAVTWLQTAASVSGKDLRAVIVGCGNDALQEYRVGFNIRGSDDVVYGCIWPLLSKDEALTEALDAYGPTIPDEITAVLKEAGVSEVRRIPGLMECDVCDGCGAPYFPDLMGELQHPELPDETDTEPIILH